MELSPRAKPALVGSLTAATLALAVFVPPVVYQVGHFGLPFNDVGTYVRPMWNLFALGRMVVYSDGTSEFLQDQHFEPFLFLLAPIVRLFGTMGYIGAITVALAASAAYVFLLTARVCGSTWIGLLAAAAYGFNPYTQGIALSYHIEPFGLLFLLAFAYYHYVGANRLAWIALVLALTVKEDMAVYACVVVVMLTRPGQLKSSMWFVAASLTYYVGAVVLFWHWLYPTGYYRQAFYVLNGRPLTKTQIALSLLGRWREYALLLFTGAGGAFQSTLLFVTIFAGWRYLLVAGMMLVWLTYPEGPPRSNFAYYYSYPALLLSFVCLPFALRTLAAFSARLERSAIGNATVPLVPILPAVMAVMMGYNVALHLPGHSPVAVEEKVDPRQVYGPGSRVNAPLVRTLIDQHLRHDDGSVFAQYYTIMSIPQRALMYVTYHDGGHLLDGTIEPTFVLLDLDANDPIAPPGISQDIAAMLRRRDRYLPIWDEQNVLLYRRSKRAVRP